MSFIPAKAVLKGFLRHGSQFKLDGYVGYVHFLAAYDEGDQKDQRDSVSLWTYCSTSVSFVLDRTFGSIYQSREHEQRAAAA